MKNKALAFVSKDVKMPQITLFHFGESEYSKNQSKPLIFYYKEDFPFPLSMQYPVRLTFGIAILLIVFGGLSLRRMIFKYLGSPDAKLNHINSLIWIDQLCGLVSGTLNLIYGSSTLILPMSLRSILGSQFCNWIPFGPCINLTGSIIWSTIIAVYRILYIKAQQWVKYKVGEELLLKIMIFLGVFLQLALSVVIFYFDDESLVGKLCNHFSSDDLEIFQKYRVSINVNLLSKL